MTRSRTRRRPLSRSFDLSLLVPSFFIGGRANRRGVALNDELRRDD